MTEDAEIMLRGDPSGGDDIREGQAATSISTGSRNRSRDTGRQLATQIYQYLPGAVIPAVLYLAGSAIFTRILSSAEFGRYTLSVTGTVLVSVLTSQWLQQGINRFLPGAEPGHYERNLRSAIAAALVLLVLPVAGALGLMGILGALALGSPSWVSLILPAAGLVLAMSVYAPVGTALQATMQARRFSAYQMMDAALRLGLGVGGIVWVHRGAPMLVWAAVVSLSVLVPLAWRDAGLPTPRAALAQMTESRDIIRRMATYGVPMTGWYVAFTLIAIGDRYLLQYARGPVEVGIYAANYTLVAGGVSLLSAPIVTAMHPFLVASWNRSRNANETARWLGRIVEWFLHIGMLMVVLLALFAQDAAQLLLGSEFREGAMVMPVTMGGFVLWQIGLYTQKPLELSGQTRLMFALALGALTVNVSLNLVLLPRLGYECAAYTKAVAYGTYVVASVGASRGIVVPDVRWGRVGTGALMTLVLGAVVAGVRSLVAAAAGVGYGMFVAISVAALGSGVIVLFALRRSASSRSSRSAFGGHG